MYDFIQAALKAGNAAHIFRSGGGLRVVRMEKGTKRGELLGYGEYCNVEPALDICDRQLAGKKSKFTTQYLTGSASPTSKLDEWVLCGYDTNFKWENGEFIFFSHMEYMDIRTPQEVVDRVIKTGNTEEWGFEGRRYRSSLSVYGSRGCSSKCLTSENYIDAWSYPVNHLLSADTFEGLLAMLEERLGDMDKFEKVIKTLGKDYTYAQPYVVKTDVGVAIFSSKEEMKKLLNANF